MQRRSLRISHILCAPVLAISLTGCETTGDIAEGAVGLTVAAGGAALSGAAALGSAALSVGAALGGAAIGATQMAGQAAALGAAGAVAGAATSAAIGVGTAVVGAGVSVAGSAVSAAGNAAVSAVSGPATQPAAGQTLAKQATRSSTPQTSNNSVPVSLDMQGAAKNCLSKLVDGDIGIAETLDSLVKTPFDPSKIGERAAKKNADGEFADDGIKVAAGPGLGFCLFQADSLPLKGLKLVAEKVFHEQFGDNLSVTVMDELKLNCSGLSFMTPAGRFDVGLGDVLLGCGPEAPSRLAIKKAIS